MKSKTDLRKALRAARKSHVADLPDQTRALLFLRPPAPLLELIPEQAAIGLYRSTPEEAPTASYARFFFERGHRIALPRLESRDDDMRFAEYADPYEAADLEPGAFGLLQPGPQAEPVDPDVLFVPLVGFTGEGQRLGQGGGHYDKWLGAHPETLGIGLAWDCQLVEDLPTEDHDVPLSAIVTPTRMFGPF